MTTFIIVWIGQLLSLIGSELTGFALGVWVYQQNGSATQFAIISLCTILPAIVVTPFAGVFIDRWDRRGMMILSDTGAGMSTLVLALLLATGNLTLPYIYAMTAIASCFSGFQRPAFVSATSLLLPPDQLNKGSGLMSMNDAVSRLVAPALGGVLLGLINLEGVMLIDCITFLTALTTLLVVRFPPVPMAANQPEDLGKNASFWSEFTVAWTFLRRHPGLLGLLSFFCAKNVLQGMIIVLMTPLALSFSTPKMLGIVLSIGGLGMVIGSVIFASSTITKRRTSLIFTFTVLLGLSVFAAGFRVSVPLFTVSVFLYSVGLPFLHGAGQVIFQLKTPPVIQGRLFSFNEAIAGLALPLGYGVAGPLSDYVFEPLMATDGLLAGLMGPVIGVGPGRGIGLFFMSIGCLHVVLAWVAYQYQPLRWVETRLPDAQRNLSTHSASTHGSPVTEAHSTDTIIPQPSGNDIRPAIPSLSGTLPFQASSMVSSSTKLYKVACIDDSSTILRSVELFLDPSYFQTITISDPVRALALILRHKPDLILLDIMMPHLDGYQLCSLLRKNKLFKETPIVMATSRKGLIDKTRARLCGASGYLVKPFNKADLMAEIFQYLT